MAPATNGRDGKTRYGAKLNGGVVHIALRCPEIMKTAVLSPAFRPQAPGIAGWTCSRPFRLKAGLRTDFPREINYEDQKETVHF